MDDEQDEDAAGLLNAGLPWTDASIADLMASLEHGADVADTADFLNRTQYEVRAKIKELGLTIKRLPGAIRREGTKSSSQAN